MGKKTVLVSDLTGDEIPEGESATIRVESNSRVALVEAHRDEEVVQTLLSAGRQVKKRGRPKKA